MMFYFILFFLLHHRAQAKDSVTIDFIRDYVQNERKPTILYSNYLCWKKDRQINMFKALSKSGIRISSVFDGNTASDRHHIMFLFDLDCSRMDDLINATEYYRSPYRWLVLRHSSDDDLHKYLWDLPLPLDSDFVVAERNQDTFILTELFKPSLNGTTHSVPRGFFNSSLFDDRHTRELFRRRKNAMGHPLTMSNVIQDSNTTQYHLPREDRLMAKQAKGLRYVKWLSLPITTATPGGGWSLNGIENRVCQTGIWKASCDCYFTGNRTLPLEYSNVTLLFVSRNRFLQYDAAAKLNWIVVRIAAQMINATPRYIFSHRYGYKSDGQWSGMIQDLEAKRADIGTNCIPNLDRLSVASFTDCIAPIKVKFILRQPPLSYVSNIFTLPFATSVWLAIIMFIFVSSIAVYLANKWEASSSQSQTLRGNVADAVFFTISSLSQQSTANEPRRFSGRIILWVIFIAMMSLYTAYCANIVVLLQAPSTAFKTLEQLRNSKITLSALDIDYNHFVLKAQKDPIRQDIYKKIVPDTGKTHFCHLNDCIEKLRKGLFAFHAIVEPIYRRIDETFLETEKCDLIEIDYFNGVDTFVPVSKDLPYLELLRVAFKRIRESGLLAALQKRLMMTKPRCTNKTAFSSVGLVNLRPVIILMICGFAASIVTWIGEVIVHKITGQRRRLHLSKKKQNMNR